MYVKNGYESIKKYRHQTLHTVKKILIFSLTVMLLIGSISMDLFEFILDIDEEIEKDGDKILKDLKRLLPWW